MTLHPSSNQSHGPATDSLLQASTRAALRVLVVDDCSASADALSAYLQAGGMTVQTVYHGSDALRAAKDWMPDCIVLDIAMPGLSGIGVAASLRRQEATARIPLLAFTAYDTADQLREMSDAGFDAICTKPADLRKLECLIADLAGYPPPVDSHAAASSQATPIATAGGL